MATGWLSRLVRITACGALGAAVPALLFGALAAAVRGDAGAGRSAIRAHQIDFSFRAPEETLARKRAKKVQAPTPSPLPPTGSVTLISDGWPGAGEGEAPLRAESVSYHPGPGAVAPFSGIDADPQPIVRIPPEYPSHGRGEGWVLVQFDVTPAGTVENVQAVDAMPRGVFERNALRAVERWRYRPAVVEGRAVARKGLRVVIRFEITEA